MNRNFETLRQEVFAKIPEISGKGLGLEQNSSEWLEWRRKGIGASDAPIIMGESPYSTPVELWKEKRGIGVEFKGNWATERGQRLEPAARAIYEIFNSREMPALLVEHRDFPFLRASLDGANVEEKILLEIKCIGKETFRIAKEDKVIPRHHWIQMQHQLLVTGFHVGHYFAFWEGKGALVEIVPDLMFFSELLKNLLIFWNENVLKGIEPELIALDLKKRAAAERKAIREAKKNGISAGI